MLYKSVTVLRAARVTSKGGVHISAYALAQLNVATMREPLDAPGMAGFVDHLDRLNALADAAPGFVWRLQDEGGDATAMRPLGEHVLVNMSVWRDVESLSGYVYGENHVALMRRRRQWFEQMKERRFVLWWVPARHRPTLPEGISRLERLRKQGPTNAAFTFRRAFPPPGTSSPG